MTPIARSTALSATVVAALALAPCAYAERHYDCSKPGNANKAACKAPTAVVASPAAAPQATVTSSTPTRRYDCSKPGNANKAACKGAVSAATTTPVATSTAPAAAPAKPSIFSRILKPKAQPAAAPAPSVARAAIPTSTAPVSSYNGKSITTDPAGATGQCRDGAYTHATHHSGACSSHGGVAKWMQ